MEGYDSKRVMLLMVMMTMMVVVVMVILMMTTTMTEISDRRLPLRSFHSPVDRVLRASERF
jgi:heme/copper-type cytochrome/quinol oxidase subunit 2